VIPAFNIPSWEGHRIYLKGILERGGPGNAEHLENYIMATTLSGGKPTVQVFISGKRCTRRVRQQSYPPPEEISRRDIVRKTFGERDSLTKKVMNR